VVEIPFGFHKGIRFDNLDDSFDRNFLSQIPPCPPLLKGGLGGLNSSPAEGMCDETVMVNSYKVKGGDTKKFCLKKSDRKVRKWRKIEG